MKTTQTIIILVAAALVSSCNLYKNYERPADVKIENLYGENIPGGMANDSIGLGCMEWRSLFTDPVLQTYIETGLKQNTDMQVAQLRIEQSRATLSAAKLAYIPSFILGGQGALSGIDWGKSTQSYTLPVTASWQIGSFGSLRNAKKRAKVQVLQSETYKQAVQVNLIATIANYYYTLVMLDEQLRISEQTSVNWKRNVEVNKALMEAGESNDAAVSQSEANYYAVCSQVIDLKQQIRALENNFSVLLGETPYVMQRGNINSWVGPAEVNVGIPAVMLANRPDVKAAEYALASAFYATNEARAAFYPSLTLSGTIGWSNAEGTVNPGKWIYSALGQLTQPLFMNGALRAKLKISKAQQEEAKLAFRQTLLDAGAEVNTALSKIQNNEEKATHLDLQILSLERAVKSTQALMVNSPVNYLQVLTAQQGLLAAQISQVTNKFNCIQGTIELYQALGGGAIK